MNSEKTTKAKRDKNVNAQENESFYVTLPSTMNYNREKQEEEESYGYPDFYEDTDNMNRYLW